MQVKNVVLEGKIFTAIVIFESSRQILAAAAELLLKVQKLQNYHSLAFKWKKHK